jgi:DNA-binding MarR family transcriptional regulator
MRARKRASSPTRPAKKPRSPTPAEYEQAAAARQAVQTYLRTSEKAMRLQGLTAERYQLLLRIKVAELRGEPITVSQLATALQLAKSTTTQLVRRAENQRLLKREISEHDARVRYVHLTDEGKARLGAVVADLREDRARFSREFPALTD